MSYVTTVNPLTRTGWENVVIRNAKGGGFEGKVERNERSGRAAQLKGGAAPLLSMHILRFLKSAVLLFERSPHHACEKLT